RRHGHAAGLASGLRRKGGRYRAALPVRRSDGGSSVNPAVVVLAHNRPRALERLLASIAEGAYPPAGNVPLIVSIDAGGSPDVRRLAEAFPWSHGQKRVIVAEAHLGLVEHFHRAGALAKEYGSVILLEDDLVVSPPYYVYATGAFAFYRDENRIAGESLYTLWFAGYNPLPLVPLPENSVAPSPP